ncbi:hypothetical protein LEP1GSC151_3139 [Leptospira interrogans serovar Grippotyphosa str. LT2186]|uniref:Uncharacterized protein n=1 Tax=Leptospira interrogans serovar Grippotyphosa str. LT2186 TaxID=1001599 RepID=M3I7V5_LEPIR|nr:hypothetical protein LEP1GSC151_3139 [Leptospira interrogans serovar Grippotyphosa str. LT2186]EMO92158.1 hypothetical protein LEP1GSC109_0372 [Leptospira interrogans str. UI 13372]
MSLYGETGEEGLLTGAIFFTRKLSSKLVGESPIRVNARAR